MKSLFILFSLLVSNYIFSQTTEQIMKSELEKMKFVYLNKQFKIYSSFIYPKVFEIYGGQEKFVQATKLNFEQDEKSGFKIKNIYFKNFNDLIIEKNEIQTSFTQVVISDTPQGKTSEEVTIVGISGDNGKSWKFIDTSAYNQKKHPNIYQTLNEKVNLKSTQKDRFNEDDLKNKCLDFKNLELETTSPFTFRKLIIQITADEQKEISDKNEGFIVSDIIRDSKNPCKMDYIVKEIHNKPNSKTKIGDTLHVEIVTFHNEEYYFLLRKNSGNLIVPDKSKVVRKL